VITQGQLLVVDNSHLASMDPLAEITINVPQRMLFFMRDGRVTAYPITVGSRDWPTPLGRFTIVDKELDPVWDVPVSIQQEMARQGKPVITRMAPSPENPLGAHWLRLSIPGLGIHGTNAPNSIYRYASHGCIRMHPGDVAALFEQVEIGATGALIYQPVVLAVIDDRVWLEAHQDPYRRAPQALSFVRQEAARRMIEHRIDWSKVTDALRLRAGRPVDVGRRE
jgi:L,D-transpeptidase ErfK/SrfK